MLYYTLSVFSTYGTHYFHEVVFILLAVLKKVKDFDAHVISTFIIYFFKSLLYKSSYTISWIYHNLYHVYNISPFNKRHNVFGYQKTNADVLRHTVHEDTSI